MHVSFAVTDPPLHSYPSSMVQVLLQPSLESRLSSSHSSNSCLRPSPQTGSQLLLSSETTPATIEHRVQVSGFEKDPPEQA